MESHGEFREWQRMRLKRYLGWERALVGWDFIKSIMGKQEGVRQVSLAFSEFMLLAV